MSEKTFYIIAGANGSGKSTFGNEFTKVKNMPFLNADDIASDHFHDNVKKNRISAGKIFIRRLRSYLTMNQSFAVESTLSGQYLLEYIQKAREYNFLTIIIYIFLETADQNVYRVGNRRSKGGHDVPPDDIVRRYERSKKLFWNSYRNIADDWLLFYNGEKTFRPVAQAGEVIDNKLMNTFMKGVK